MIKANILKLIASVAKHCPKLVWQARSLKRRHKIVHIARPRCLYDMIVRLSIDNANNPLWSLLADKWGVREYIAEHLGEEYLIPSLGCYESVGDIDFEKLPNEFVLKTNNGCSSNVIVSDKSKLDIRATKAFLKSKLEQPYGELTGQLHYSHIKPLIVAEKLMKQGGANTSLIDYKFYCINSKIETIVVITNRKANNHTPETIVRDANWQSVPEMTNQNVVNDVALAKPEHFDELKDIVVRLSKPFKFVRVDMYVIGGRIYFGEFTFTPYSEEHFSTLGCDYIFNKIKEG
jgi:hypothetical protein